MREDVEPHRESLKSIQRYMLRKPASRGRELKLLSNAIEKRMHSDSRPTAALRSMLLSAEDVTFGTCASGAPGIVIGCMQLGVQELQMGDLGLKASKHKNMTVSRIHRVTCSSS